MAISVKPPLLAPGRDLRALLLKWTVALLVPVAVFLFVWNGEVIINSLWLQILHSPPRRSIFNDTAAIIEVGLFFLAFFVTLIALVGYLVAADTGRYGQFAVWADVFFYIVVPILFIVLVNHLLIGIGLSLLVIPLYLLARNLLRKRTGYIPPPPLERLEVLDSVQQAHLLGRGRLGGFWFATTLALVWLLADIGFYAAGSLPTILFVWVALRTILFPVLGYFLGDLGGRVALRQSLATDRKDEDDLADAGEISAGEKVGRLSRLQHLSTSRAREEARNLVPNDQPLQSSGARRFYLPLLVLFALLYPALDRPLFGPDPSRLLAYGDLGYYIILALGLNIVVGFAGLLDLGYVAFFVLGTYAWALVGSGQLEYLTHITISPQLLPWLFWPMLIVAALIAALWGLLLGAPTLRLRGDYLAIVTLGFGEIIPIVFLQMDNITNGSIGLSGIATPVTPSLPPLIPAIQWSNTSATPFYYLIMALIVFTIFTNVRLRDSRLGRAWIAMREDEIAAASSGINLVKTKLFAFAAGAFFSGIAGTYHAAKLGTVTAKDFNSTDSIMFLAMVVIGGLGSIPGVILGAIVVFSLNILIIPQLDRLVADKHHFLHFIQLWLPNFHFQNVRYLVFGVLLVVIMIFRPEGLLPSARRQRELHQSAAQEPEPELGSLDPVPGTAGFEEEVRVD